MWCVAQDGAGETLTLAGLVRRDELSVRHLAAIDDGDAIGLRRGAAVDEQQRLRARPSFEQNVSRADQKTLTHLARALVLLAPVLVLGQASEGPANQEERANAPECSRHVTQSAPTRSKITASRNASRPPERAMIAMID